MPDLPTQKVKEMMEQGLTNEEITRSLEGQGYNLDQISTAMNQSQIGAPAGMQESTMQDIPIPEQAPVQEVAPEQYAAPDMSQYQQQLPQQQTSYEDIQAIVEEILEEKWKEFIKDVGDVGLWKSKISDDLEATKQELVRTQKRLEDLQVAVLGKVKDYSKTMQDIGTDMKALEKVFGNILEPLTKNIKELNKVTENIKKHKK
ncbi:hypothetical protein CL616_05040 [archaeon]|nr:hypothetical protein [archaeon]|tara:strand:- start:1650 stop:2258 length:609 start_codon:yes stop_codon:yes gene_type:complete